METAQENLYHTQTSQAYQNENSNGTKKHAIMNRKRKNAPTSSDAYEDSHYLQHVAAIESGTTSNCNHQNQAHLFYPQVHGHNISGSFSALLIQSTYYSQAS